MNKTIGMVLLASGIALIIFGVSAADSVSSDISRFFTGTPTDKSVWLLLVGIVATMLGAFTTLRKA